MKKLIYLCLCVAASTAFVSCNKLNDAYKAIDANAAAGNAGQTLTYTLTSADFTSLGSANYAYKTHNFSTAADANTSIPTILNFKFPNYNNGSTAFITYGEQPVLPDSVYKDEQYTLTSTPSGNNDYTLYPGNKYADFSVSQVISWLPYKFGSVTVGTPPPANTTYVLNWIFYPTLAATAPQIYPGVQLSTTGSVTTAISAFSFINNAWVADYYLTPAQYAAVGRGQYNQFTSSDDANLVSYFNAILKADAGVMATATTGAVQYVSYNYYNSAKATTQRVMAMYYNGTNWVPNAPVTGIFVKQNGTWIPDPSIYHTLTSADITIIVNGAAGAASAKSNLSSYGDFNIATGYWTVADLDNAFIEVLQADFPAPKSNLNYKVVFQKYQSGGDVATTYVFVYNGTQWVAQQ
jgi:hypothetical protein